MIDRTEKINFENVVKSVSAYIDNNGGPRLLWGIGLIVLLQVAFLFNWIGKVTQEREIALATIESEVKINRALANDDEIADRLKTASQTVQSFRERLYEAATTGLMSADIEAFLRQSADEVGLDRVQISLNFEKTDNKEIVRFVADITAQEKEGGSFPLFLSKILSADEAYYVSSMSWNKRVKRLNLKVECVGRLVEAET